MYRLHEASILRYTVITYPRYRGSPGRDGRRSVWCTACLCKPQTSTLLLSLINLHACNFYLPTKRVSKRENIGDVSKLFVCVILCLANCLSTKVTFSVLSGELIQTGLKLDSKAKLDSSQAAI